MSKLKDYKDKIKGWPGKKESYEMVLDTANTVYKSYENKGRMKGFNQAHEIFSNLEFNPAELVELDFDKIGIIILQAMCGYSYKEACNLWTGKHYQFSHKVEATKLAIALVKAFENGEIIK